MKEHLTSSSGLQERLEQAEQLAKAAMVKVNCLMQEKEGLRDAYRTKLQKIESDLKAFFQKLKDESLAAIPSASSNPAEARLIQCWNRVESKRDEVGEVLPFAMRRVFNWHLEKNAQCIAEEQALLQEVMTRTVGLVQELQHLKCCIHHVKPVPLQVAVGRVCSLEQEREDLRTRVKELEGADKRFQGLSAQLAELRVAHRQELKRVREESQEPLQDLRRKLQAAESKIREQERTWQSALKNHRKQLGHEIDALKSECAAKAGDIAQLAERVTALTQQLEETKDALGKQQQENDRLIQQGLFAFDPDKIQSSSADF